MSIYKATSLYNLEVNRQIDIASKEYHYLTQQQATALKLKYPAGVYQPNIFVRIGLAILTFFAVLATFGLLFMMLNLGANGIEVFLVFAGLICYAMAELMIARQWHYNAGVDNTLLIAVPLLIVGGITSLLHGSETLSSLVSFVICTWITYRFVDSLFAIAATCSLLAFIFYGYLHLGHFTIYTFPFVIIIACCALYALARTCRQEETLVFYSKCFQLIEMIALIGIYGFGNFFIVHELTKSIVLNDAITLQPGWLFWLWTFAIPVIYLAKGIISKDLTMARLGVIFIAAAVLTFRSYYALMPAENALVIAGAVLVLASYFLMKYLRVPRRGFVFAETKKATNNDTDLEGLIAGETFLAQHAPVAETTFGGGSFGGGGAGSNY